MMISGSLKLTQVCLLMLMQKSCWMKSCDYEKEIAVCVLHFFSDFQDLWLPFLAGDTENGLQRSCLLFALAAVEFPVLTEE